jgi:hypothetical protein
MAFRASLNVTGVTLWEVKWIAVFIFKILELLYKAALIAMLCAVETLGLQSSARVDVLSTYSKFIS